MPYSRQSDELATGRDHRGDHPFDNEILTAREAQALLKIGRTKLWELTKANLIPAYRMGDGGRSSLRFKRSELLAWLEQNRV